MEEGKKSTVGLFSSDVQILTSQHLTRVVEEAERLSPN